MMFLPRYGILLLVFMAGSSLAFQAILPPSSSRLASSLQQVSRVTDTPILSSDEDELTSDDILSLHNNKRTPPPPLQQFLSPFQKQMQRFFSNDFSDDTQVSTDAAEDSVAFAAQDEQVLQLWTAAAQELKDSQAENKQFRKKVNELKSQVEELTAAAQQVTKQLEQAKAAATVRTAATSNNHIEHEVVPKENPKEEKVAVALEDWGSLPKSTLQRKTVKQLTGYLTEKGVECTDTSGKTLKKDSLVGLVLSN